MNDFLTCHEKDILYSTVLTKDWHVKQNEDDSVSLSLIDIYGRKKTLHLPLSLQDFVKCLKLYVNGTIIQHAFPNINNTQREFMLTGMDDEEWDDLMDE